MNSDIQQIIALVIVGISAIWLIRNRVLARRRAKLRPCGHDCGCSSEKAIKSIRPVSGALGQMKDSQLRMKLKIK